MKFSWSRRQPIRGNLDFPAKYGVTINVLNRFNEMTPDQVETLIADVGDVVRARGDRRLRGKHDDQFDASPELSISMIVVSS